MTRTPGVKDRELARRGQLLEAALDVFARFGFRKTSMDEVARAAQVSRQGLYLHFPTKEDLFRATVHHLLESALQQASAALENAELALEARLVQAFDEWVGRFVGMFAGSAADLADASRQLVLPMVTEYENRFMAVVATALRQAGLSKAYKAQGLNSQKLARVLHSSARGFKYSAASRAEFVADFTLTVRALCRPPS
jgi:TetR/AcrR family transcriptional regulator, regulator of autoinduction and epiphytic fitness